MNKKLGLVLPLLVMVIGVFNSKGQSVENGSFENWTLNQKGGFEDPDNWTTSNQWTTNLAAGAGITKSTDAANGKFAAKLITLGVGFAGQPFAAYMINGTLQISKTTGAPNLATAGMPMKTKPAALMGSYKYSAILPGDSAEAVVYLKAINNKGKVDTVAIGTIKLGPAATYTRFRIEILDIMPMATPDSIVIAFFSTNPTNPVHSGQLHLDSLEFDFATSIENWNAKSDVGLSVYPIPASTQVTIELSDFNGAYLLQVFSSMGKLVMQKQVTKAQSIIDISRLNTGHYFFQCANANKVFGSGKFVVED